MRNYHLRKNTKWCPSLNLDKLWTLVSEQTRLKYKNSTDGKAPVIDLVKAVSKISSFDSLAIPTPNEAIILNDDYVNGRT